MCVPSLGIDQATKKREMHARTLEQRRQRDLARGKSKGTYVSKPKPIIKLSQAGYIAHQLLDHIRPKLKPWLSCCGSKPAHVRVFTGTRFSALTRRTRLHSEPCRSPSSFLLVLTTGSPRFRHCGSSGCQTPSGSA